VTRNRSRELLTANAVGQMLNVGTSAQGVSEKSRRGGENYLLCELARSPTRTRSSVRSYIRSHARV
jgi:hypothetical protein